MGDFEKYDAYDKVDVTWSDRTTQTPLDELRHMLCERRADYEVDGYNSRMPYQIWWRGKGDASCTAEDHGDHLLVTVRGRMTPTQAIDMTLGQDADRIATAHGAVGHCNCSKCGGRIDTCDAWCRHCGSRLTETKYVTEGEA